MSPSRCCRSIQQHTYIFKFLLQGHSIVRVALTAYQSISVIWSITNKIFHQLKAKKVPLCKPLLTPESDQQLISPNSIPPEHCHCRHLKFSFFFFKGNFQAKCFCIIHDFEFLWNFIYQFLSIVSIVILNCE